MRLTALSGQDYTPLVISSESLGQFGDRVAARSPNGRFPYAGQWELTCRCNLRCAMCYTDPFNTPEQIPKELSFVEVARILREIADAGCVELVLTGGEPLARPDFLQIYRVAHDLGLALTIFTNATLITREVIALWRQRPPKAIEVSLHGVTKGVFESVTRAPGSFQKVIDAITCLIAYQLPVTLKAPALTLNKEEILKLAEFARIRNLPFRLGEALRDDLKRSGAPFQYQLDAQRLDAIVTLDPAMQRERFADRDNDMIVDGCAGGQETFHIDAYGQLQRCSNNRRQGYDLRTGSFVDGFFQAMPTFACPKRVESLPATSETSVPSETPATSETAAV